ncbi:MAG: hypothetical protein A2X31_09540 [Elusimicrobia bacterium GWB2_63_22]|nr:MAG: hypothetical protein A2X31_09540 [Elusimicrobia bacterium GWB2_63_22]
MLLKELIRVTINLEMESVSIFEVEAETFGRSHEKGAEIKEIFLRLAREKRTRLKKLGGYFKEGTGFRERSTQPSRSIEAAMRNHVSRSERAIVCYTGLYKQLTKQIFKDAMAAMLADERVMLADLKAFQAGFKK